MVNSPQSAIPYASYFEQHLESRLASAPTDPKVSISVVTTVYIKTNVALFLETAKSIKAQTVTPHEWLVLSHGPISDDLSTALERLRDEGALRWLTLDKNLGIQGGLRYCLEQATGKFILSLDADDLLTPDAIALLSDAAAESPETLVFYSDEDILVDDVPVHPFYRPAFDPVHLFSHSYIWHCILFHRATGLELNAYTNARTEYAQDWDLLIRFVRAGHEPGHIPEILYHWRHHRSSLSNSGSLFEGSVSSIKGCLDAIRLGDFADLLSIEEYPIGPPASDFYLRRSASNVPSCLLLTMSDSDGVPSADIEGDVFCRSAHVRVDRGINGLHALKGAIEDSGETFVCLRNDTVTDFEELGILQAFKHLELVPSVQVVSGMLSSKLGMVLHGPVVRFDGKFSDLSAGRPATGNNAHMFNIWKPHCVDLPCLDLMIAGRDFLLDALAAAPANLALRSLSWWLGRTARLTKQRVAFEPLFMGFVTDETKLTGDPPASLLRAEAAFGPSDFHGSQPRGLSRIAGMSGRHMR
ncbi:MAG: glycosyltransferase [Mesorhizobium sp.]|nr:glycosyltransferase [Mesorhizobium sp. M1D.F.Ca.ET.043.01.1.1]RWA92632.1 MAG: glycosyltransferase [Mesorhizobium sp.]RWE08509.1 MAG: glycosyltransferase [Mesorhizobium sp.]TIW00869.1 MAG: glycosyltransferase [Mesorhizobium sp.]TJW89960.1 MAG: glycosyltransferase [Mesorhizobium sp.]